MRPLLVAMISGLCLTGIACADRYDGHPPYPTTGQVLVNGEPAAGAAVTFYHNEYWGERTIIPMAVTDANGRFTLSTYTSNDGAPEGRYRVTIEWFTTPHLKHKGPEKLAGRYARPQTSGLESRIHKGKNELPPFEINAKIFEQKKK